MSLSSDLTSPQDGTILTLSAPYHVPAISSGHSPILLQRRKIGTCRKNNLIKSTFPTWALTHPVTERERKSFWRGCWISCSSFPLRNVIESPPSCFILSAKISDMASSAKCPLKWLYVAADVQPITLHVGA